MRRAARASFRVCVRVWFVRVCVLLVASMVASMVTSSAHRRPAPPRHPALVMMALAPHCGPPGGTGGAAPRARAARHGVRRERASATSPRGAARARGALGGRAREAARGRDGRARAAGGRPRDRHRVVARSTSGAAHSHSPGVPPSGLTSAEGPGVRVEHHARCCCVLLAGFFAREGRADGGSSSDSDVRTSACVCSHKVWRKSAQSKWRCKAPFSATRFSFEV